MNKVACKKETECSRELGFRKFMLRDSGLFKDISSAIS
jgi:hypothetical protein